MMRVRPEYFAAMRAAIRPLDMPARRAAYLARDIPFADRVRDLDRRYRWDLFWLARTQDLDAPPIEYTDGHLDTALRRIVPVLSAE